jgi:hypothetical protein
LHEELRIVTHITKDASLDPPARCHDQQAGQPTEVAKTSLQTELACSLPKIKVG